jgi:hypothetical protein
MFDITCYNCDGFGVYDRSYHNPDECCLCNGSGKLVVYKNGSIAKYISGPFVGKLSKKEFENFIHKYAKFSIDTAL